MEEEQTNSLPETEQATASEPAQAEESEKKMSKKEFWIRFAVWFLIAVAAPFAYVCVRFGIFTNTEPTTKVSGWGIIAFVFLGIMAVKIIRSARKGLSYGSMAAQIIDGVTVLIPIICFTLILELIKRNVDAFEEFLIFTIICEAVAIPVNPMRRWAYEHNTEAFSTIVFNGIKRFFDKKDKK